MRKRSYSVKPNWLRRSDGVRFVILAALVVILIGSLASASTPDWLKQAAQESLPAYPDDTDAVVLLDETVTVVSPAGEVHTTYRKAYKILRPEGRNRAIVRVYFDSDTKLTFLKAWSITSRNEEYEVKEGEAAETSAFSESLYEDTRYKLLQIPAAQPGSVIGYEYQQRGRPSVSQSIWSFQDKIPVKRSRFSLQLPANWSYAAYWRNHPVLAPQQTGDNRWTWELTQIEPVRPEPQMPTWTSVAGYMGLSFAAQTPNPSSSSYDSWAQIGHWYGELTKAPREATPAIRDKAREIVGGVTDPLEKIRRVAFYVQHNIRYVAIEIGIGGYQPHAANDVLASGYGDCKDKATLLNVMLHEVGIESYYVLVNADRDYLAPEFPSPLNFDHVILAIRLPGAGDTPGMFAILPHKKLGPLLLFDPTDSSTPIGYLPASLQSSHGLLVTDADGELVQLPLLRPSLNRLLRVGTLTLDTSGNLKGSVNEVRIGPAAAELRERLLNSPKSQREKVFQSLLTDLLDGAVLTAAGVSDINEFDGSLSVTYDFAAPAYAQHAGDLFLFHPCALGRKSSNELEGKPRKQPVAFASAVSESDVIEISFPEGYAIDELPPGVKYEYPFAAYKSETRAEKNVLHYTRTYEIRDVRVPLEQLPDLKKLFRQIADDEGAYTIMNAPETAVSAK